MPKIKEFVSRIQDSSIYFRILTIENKGKKATLILIAMGSLFVPFLVDAYVETIVVFLLIYALVGLGIYLLIGHVGIVSLGQVGFYAIGAYLSAILSTHYGLSPWISLCFAAAASGVIAYIIGKPFFEARGMSLAIITLAFSVIIYMVVARLPITGGHDGITGIPRFYIGGLRFGDDLCYYLLWVVLSVALWFAYNLTEKKIGRGLRALNEFGGGNEVAAIASGMDSTRVKTQLFVLAAVYASVAGSIFAHWMTTVNPNFFSVLVTFVFIMMVGIGGFRSIWGAPIGAAFYYGLREIMTIVLHGQQIVGGEIVVFGLIFIVILIFLPGGLTSLPNEFREWRHKWQVWRRKKVVVSEAEFFKRHVWPAGSKDFGASGVREDSRPLLQVKGVSKTFGSLVALDNVTLDVFPGEIVGIVGPNGAGKTTLFNTIAGILSPTKGEIWFDDQEITKLRTHKISQLGIGTTFQHFNLFYNMSGFHNALIGAWKRFRSNFIECMLGLPRLKEEDNVIGHSLLKELALLGVLDKRLTPSPSTLTPRDQRALTIGRAIASQPKLLLLDEPAAGLNYEEMQELSYEFQRYKYQGISILLIDHRIEILRNLSDRIIVLNFGCKVAEGTPNDILKDKEVIAIYLGKKLAYET